MEMLELTSQVRAEILRLSDRSKMLLNIDRDADQEADYRQIQTRLKVLQGPPPFQGW